MSEGINWGEPEYCVTFKDGEVIYSAGHDTFEDAKEVAEEAIREGYERVGIRKEYCLSPTIEMKVSW